jgi:hypothetical protein
MSYMYGKALLTELLLVNDTEEVTESVESEEQLFQLALNKNGESFKLWSTYVDWIEKKWKDDALNREAVDELMVVSCKH